MIGTLLSRIFGSALAASRGAMQGGNSQAQRPRARSVLRGFTEREHHLKLETLLALHARELSWRKTRGVRAHVERCGACSAQLRRIDELLRIFDRQTRCELPPALLAHGRRSLIAAMSRLGAANAGSARVPALKRAADELGEYAQVSADRLLLDGAFARVEPVLTNFLGRTTAASLGRLVAEVMASGPDSMTPDPAAALS